MTMLLRINDRFWPAFTLLALAALSALSLMPLATPLPGPISSDKLHHFVGYAAIALPVALARPRGWFLFIVSFALWGIVIELLQPLVGRARTAADIAANTAGLAAAIGASGMIRHFAGADRLTRREARSTKRPPGSSAHGRR